MVQEVLLKIWNEGFEAGIRVVIKIANLHLLIYLRSELSKSEMVAPVHHGYRLIDQK